MRVWDRSEAGIFKFQHIDILLESTARYDVSIEPDSKIMTWEQLVRMRFNIPSNPGWVIVVVRRDANLPDAIGIAGAIGKTNIIDVFVDQFRQQEVIVVAKHRRIKDGFTLTF